MRQKEFPQKPKAIEANSIIEECLRTCSLMVGISLVFEA